MTASTVRFVYGSAFITLLNLSLVFLWKARWQFGMIAEWVGLFSLLDWVGISLGEGLANPFLAAALYSAVIVTLWLVRKNARLFRALMIWFLINGLLALVIAVRFARYANEV